MNKNTKIEIIGCITSRWKRPGVLRDLPAKLYDWDAGIASEGPSPGASAQSRYAALWLRRVMKEFQVGNIRVIFDKAQEAKLFDAVAVVLFSSGRLVLVRNKGRAWEFPGGHREGNESYEETAVREAYEEAQAEITDIEYLGYYISSTEHTTVIVCVEVSSFQVFDGEYETSEVGLFDRLPSPLSFGDGREQLFVDHATRRRANRGIYVA